MASGIDPEVLDSKAVQCKAAARRLDAIKRNITTQVSDVFEVWKSDAARELDRALQEQLSKISRAQRALHHAAEALERGAAQRRREIEEQRRLEEEQRQGRP